MIISNLQINDVFSGQLAITLGRSTKYASCVLFNEKFAVMPFYIMKNVRQDDCIFEQKNRSFQTIIKKKPIKILHSSNLWLSILIFKEQETITDLVRNLIIQFNPQQLRKANRQRKNKVYVNGYGIQYGSLNGQGTYQSKKKTLKCDYRIIIDNQIHYDCPFNKNGMIGSAIYMEDQKIIGIHQGGQNQYGYGILFTTEVIGGLVSVLQNYYTPRLKMKYFPLPEDYFRSKYEGEEQLDNMYQNIYQQYQANYSQYILQITQLVEK